MLEDVWEFREVELYPSLFGQPEEGIYVLDADLFAVFGVENVDPRWLFLGVLVFPPTATRTSWLYVTSGGTTPWELDDDIDPEAPSWIGTELVIETHPIAPGVDSQLRYAAIARPSHYTADASLASGTLEFLHVVGISESERDYAKAHSTHALIERLAAAGAYPTTDPCRQPVA